MSFGKSSVFSRKSDYDEEINHSSHNKEESILEGTTNPKLSRKGFSSAFI